MKTAALVLAAGGSARLGQPKQLLPYQGEPLVRRVSAAALAAGCAPVAVVVGPKQDPIAAALRDLAVQLVPNESWERGIGSSLRAGLAGLRAADAVVILACDQPAVSAAVIRELLEAHATTGKSIVASAYAGTLGVPALFARSHFATLLGLADAEGAKTVIATHPEEVARVEFPEGAIDIDTAADYERLLQA